MSMVQPEAVAVSVAVPVSGVVLAVAIVEPVMVDVPLEPAGEMAATEATTAAKATVDVALARVVEAMRTVEVMPKPEPSLWPVLVPSPPLAVTESET